MDEIKVEVDLNEVIHPAVTINRSDRSWLTVPAELFAAYEAALSEVDRLEVELLRHIAERYPEATYIRDHVAEMEREA